jgi:hypothetical protein
MRLPYGGTAWKMFGHIALPVQPHEAIAAQAMDIERIGSLATRLQHMLRADDHSALVNPRLECPFEDSAPPRELAVTQPETTSIPITTPVVPNDPRAEN